MENIDYPASGTKKSFWEKYLFRFTCVYFFIYIFPFPLSVLTFLEDSVLVHYTAFWQTIVPWFGENILHLPYEITVFENGSGDTTYNYVQVLIFIILALLISAVWTALNKKNTDYKKIVYWLRVYVRYYLAFMLIHYGFAKIFKTQFPFPSDMRLMQTYGESSPMGLAWTFMGYSDAYNYFTGGAEVLAGALLLFRKTTLAGSLVGIGVLSNIVMMNFSYDIPVKLFSLHLLLMAVYIMLPDIKRVAGFFLMNKAVPAADISPPELKLSPKILLGIKVVIISLVIFMTIKAQVDAKAMYKQNAFSLMYQSSYDVESFTINNVPIGPGENDVVRWKLFSVFPKAGYTAVTFQNDSVKNFQSYLNTTRKSIIFPSDGFELTYEETEPGRLVLTGYLINEPIRVELRKQKGNYNLVNRGFHWINEYPFNR